MTASMPDREREIRARAEAATRCPEAVENGRLDGEHTWGNGSFTSIRCGLCGFTRPRGERAEETIELLTEIYRLREEAYLFTVAMSQRDAYAAAAVRRALEDAADDLESVDPVEWALAGQHAGHDAAERVRARAAAVASPARDCPQCGTTGACNGGPCPLIEGCRYTKPHPSHTYMRMTVLFQCPGVEGPASPSREQGEEADR